MKARSHRYGGPTLLALERAAEAIIRRHLPRDVHLRLIEETHEMLKAGAKIEDILWFLTPGGNCGDPSCHGVALADRRQDYLAFLEEHDPASAWLIRDLPPRVPRQMVVLYVGPEGVICRRWQSILAMPQAANEGAS